MTITIRPHLFTNLGETHGVHFRLITNSDLVEKFRIADEHSYISTGIVKCDHPEEFPTILADGRLPRPLHVLVITPECLFSSPDSNIIGDKCKILVMPCNSTSVGLVDIGHFLSVMEQSDVAKQKSWADRFFSSGEDSEYIDFIDDNTQTKARFSHISDQYEWFEQLGPVEWGGQQFCPAGEISVLPMFHGNYDPEKRFAINGQITLCGYPILNSGRPSFIRRDQERIYQELSGIKRQSIIATVKDGEITDLASDDPAAKPATDMLRAMFKVDSRYKIIWEIGFGSNTNMQIIDGNKAPNESYGHKNGCVHWGLGLTPWTQYHLDILCPNTKIVTSKGVCIAGDAKMNRKVAEACPCLVI